MLAKAASRSVPCELSRAGRPRRCGPMVVGLAIVVLGLVGCGENTRSAGRTPLTLEQMCDDATRLFLVSADPAKPTEVLDERAPSLLEQVMSAPAARDVLPQLKQVAEVVDLDRSEYEAHATEVDAAVAALEELLTWTFTTCKPTGPVWGCTGQRKFTRVGRSVDEATTTPAEASAATGPSETEIGKGPDGTTRSELSRTDDRVVYVWTDEDGLVQQRTIMEPDSRGWLPDTSSCP